MQNMEHNRLSDDELENVNGGTGYAPTSSEAAMIFEGVCPECYKRSGGTELGELIERGGAYTCVRCGSISSITVQGQAPSCKASGIIQ